MYNLRGNSIVLLSIILSACSMTRYTDGPINHYLTQPLPKLERPIARSFSLEKVSYQTAASMRAILISDLVNREIYTLPANLGHRVKELLKLNEKYNQQATYRALNLIAKHRHLARHRRSGKAASFNVNQGSRDAYIRRQEEMAKEAYKKGDYLKGNIYHSAASNAIVIDQSFSRAQAATNLSFGVLNAAATAGEALTKRDFIRLRNWIQGKSGAIGKSAPKGSHLSIFFLQFFDARSFQLESRNRVAVYMVLVDKRGRTRTVLEGSDIMVCKDQCKLFKLKPTAKVFEKTHHSQDIQKQIWTPTGTRYLMDNGFDPVSGFYQYVLLRHGLKKF